ncbi:hypothetical protein HK099_002407 [Clydaea vesicula]|uniref:beta-N-acetylhexosaminidase n=1 Tax=Clydaea vesicula TaxID=447962 RepID=A0AAD5TT34_9FUNG|nr:hypothetical protein HK099_002407 [Clydaea vesicula]
MALLGMNSFQLYTEDTYEIEGEPFFGYFRGGYSKKELMEVDDYAFDLGIEVFPCIQTLGHLGQILQWPEYVKVRDTAEVMLCGSEETYKLIEKMVQVSTCFRSKKIHVGCDEAHGLSEGRYKQIFGSKDSAQVFIEHLNRVNEICLRNDLEPLIWSDMLYTLAAKNDSISAYYDQNVNPLGRIPSNMTLVYWDYYHTSHLPVSQKITQHRELGFEPWVAGGIWTWNRFVTGAISLHSNALLSACKLAKIKNVFVTLWGDDGNEFDLKSAMPGFCYFSERFYSNTEDIDESIKKSFAGIFGGNLDDFNMASKVDCISQEYSSDENFHFPPNMSKKK